MKKINLDSTKLQLKKERISNLTKEEMIKVQGGQAMMIQTKAACVVTANNCTTKATKNSKCYSAPCS